MLNRYITLAALLGLLLLNPLNALAQGDIDPNDPRDRQAVMEKAGDGDSGAQLLLGFWYYYGDGVGQNLSKAFKWMQRAAYGGNATAQYTVADMYIQGEGAPYDESKAIYWLERAASQGHKQATLDLQELQAEHDSGGHRLHGDWMSRKRPDGSSFARSRTYMGDPTFVMLCVESGNCSYSFLLFRECEHDQQVSTRIQVDGSSQRFSFLCDSSGSGDQHILMASPSQFDRLDPLVRRGSSLKISFPGDPSGQGHSHVFSLKGSAAAIDRAKSLVGVR